MQVPTLETTVEIVGPEANPIPQDVAEQVAALSEVTPNVLAVSAGEVATYALAAVVSSADGEVVGFAGLKHQTDDWPPFEVRSVIAKYQGQGYGGSALDELMGSISDHSENLGLTSDELIFAWVSEHPAAGKMFSELGFVAAVGADMPTKPNKTFMSVTLQDLAAEHTEDS